MKDDCMDLKFGKGYRYAFYREVEGLRKLTGSKLSPQQCYIGGCFRDANDYGHYCNKHKKFDMNFYDPDYHVCPYRNCVNQVHHSGDLCKKHIKFKRKSRKFIYGLEGDKKR